MLPVKSFRELLIWQEAYRLAVIIYEKTALFPVSERYGLTSQMRRCAVSVAVNIAEGKGRKTVNDFCHFLTMARGSIQEMMALTLICKDVRFLDGGSSEEIVKRYSGLDAATNKCMENLYKLNA